MNALQTYRDLQQRLLHIRWAHQGHESGEEDQVLDRMDQVWKDLSSEEINLLNQEPPLPDL